MFKGFILNKKKGVYNSGNPIVADDILVVEKPVVIPETVAASETEQGIIELATQAEVNAGTDAVRAVTPATLAGMPASGSSRFGFAGEDDTTAEDREVLIGANNRIFLDTANSNAKFEVGSKIDVNQWRARMEVRNNTFSSYIKYDTDNKHTSIAHSGANINLEAYDYITSRNFTIGLSTGGYWLENGFETLTMPIDKGGYFPLSVNGEVADSAGNIVIPKIAVAATASITVSQATKSTEWQQFTGASPTYTIDSGAAGQDFEIEGSFTGTGVLTIVGGAGITISYPAELTNTIPPNGVFGIKFITATTGLLFGTLIPA